MIAFQEDVDTLKQKYVNNEFLVPDAKWNHVDFLWANEAPKLVYNCIISNMQQDEGDAGLVDRLSNSTDSQGLLKINCNNKLMNCLELP